MSGRRIAHTPEGPLRGPTRPHTIVCVNAGDELREAMRRFPVGVSVVTVDLEGEKLGLTVASLSSLALDPPLVGVSVARQAALHELLRASGGFAVSMLAGDQ